MELAIKIINIVIMSGFALCFSYQLIYLVMKYVKRKKVIRNSGNHNYAVLIAARNEQKVIGRLIQSIKNQTYDKGTVDIYVVADNCTDLTEEIARNCGAHVYVRNNYLKVGKGYALDFLLGQLKEEKRLEQYDAFFIFDADNILNPDYIEEMDKVFAEGYQAVTSYRNSTNFGENWISYGYALWFLHEAQFLNKGRFHAGTSCMVSGTGYMISKQIIKDNDGWKYHLLTEDIEFSIDCVLKDIKIGYCETAEFYDEQPTTFKTSWNQRLRWVKGYYQVFGMYGKELLKKGLGEVSLTCFDMIMGYLPALFLTAIAAVSGIAMLTIEIAMQQSVLGVAESLGMFVVKTFALVFVIGLYTLIGEWKHIRVSPAKKIGYLLLFPFFIYTYFPIAIVASFKKVTWKPIEHGCVAPKRILRKWS